MKITVWAATIDDDANKVNGPISTHVRGTEQACWDAVYAYLWEQHGIDPGHPVGPVVDRDAVLAAAQEVGVSFQIDSGEVEIPVEILHVRDPDSACSTAVWANGRLASGVMIEDVDPGRGYTTEDWQETTRSIEEDVTVYSEDFKATVLQARNESASSQHVG